MKILAIVALMAGAVGGFQVAGGFGITIGGVSVVLAVVLHAAGTVIAAMGEGLLALGDIATNTTPRSLVKAH